MTPFNVLTLGDFISKDALELVIESFASFYDDLTPKHKRKVHLFVIGGENFGTLIKELRIEFELGISLEHVESSDENQIKALYNSDSVLVLPIKKEIGKIIPEAFSFGIPVLCFDTPPLREVADYTCAMFAPVKAKTHCMPYFKRNIEILYFDPEVRKILSRGASKRYDNMYAWGRAPAKIAVAG